MYSERNMLEVVMLSVQYNKNKMILYKNKERYIKLLYTRSHQYRYPVL